MSLITLEDKIYIAGHTGLAGNAILNEFKLNKFDNLILTTRDQVDLLNNNEVEAFFAKEKPNVVILAAAKVGGILANNTFRTEFFMDNIQIQNNVIMNAYKYGVHRFIFLGSSCVYPKNAPQPINELSLHTGALEYTNRPYAIAKLSGMELIHSLRSQYGKDYFSIMPTNLLGDYDNYHPDNSHVVASLIRKTFEAVKNKNNNIIVWGDGSPLRELMHASSLAKAILFLGTKVNFETIEESYIGKNGFSHINVGSGDEISIKDLVNLIVKYSGFKGDIIYDLSKPNGTPRKIMDSSFLNTLGWKNTFKLTDAIQSAIESYLSGKVKA